MQDRQVSDTVYKVGHQSADDPMEFVMSTSTEDLMGDTIKQSGWNLKSFRKNPISLWQHNNNFPIGTWKGVKVIEGKLRGTLELAAKGTSQLIDEIRSLLEQRVLRAVSVGFTAQKHERIMDDDDNWTGGFNFLKQTLLETSVVSVPANPEALQLAKSLGISDVCRNLVFGDIVEDEDLKALARGVKAAQSNYDDLLGTSSRNIREMRRLEHM